MKKKSRTLEFDFDTSALEKQIDELMGLLIPGVFSCADDFIEHFKKVFTDVSILNLSKALTTDDAITIKVGVVIHFDATASAMRAFKSNAHKISS